MAANGDATMFKAQALVNTNVYWASEIWLPSRTHLRDGADMNRSLRFTGHTNVNGKWFCCALARDDDEITRPARAGGIVRSNMCRL